MKINFSIFTHFLHLNLPQKTVKVLTLYRAGALVVVMMDGSITKQIVPHVSACSWSRSSSLSLCLPTCPENMDHVKHINIALEAGVVVLYSFSSGGGNTEKICGDWFLCYKIWFWMWNVTGSWIWGWGVRRWNWWCVLCVTLALPRAPSNNPQEAPRSQIEMQIVFVFQLMFAKLNHLLLLGLFANRVVVPKWINILKLREP